MAPIIFVTLYVVTIMGVCVLNADLILADAVVGVPLVAAVYMMFFLPTCVAGLLAVALDGLTPKSRLVLSGVFAALLGVFLICLFAFARSPHLGPAILESEILLVAAGNVVLIASYLGIARIRSRRDKEATQAAV